MKVLLSKISTKAPKKEDKEKVKKKTAKLQEKIGELQAVLYAQAKYSLLVIFQGMDASGKDGAVKNVFEAVNPAGCRVIGFKKPTDLEMKHDFLWRIHQNVPEKGMIHIFNRSQYEDVLIQRVHKWIDEKTVKQRFQNINDFERLLVENNTIVLKFFLHVSKEEQLLRLKERISDPTKNWKYNEIDLKERDFWNQYQKAYEDVLEQCDDTAKWQIIPTDQNWWKEYLICKTIVEALSKLDLKYPVIQQSQTTSS